MKFLISNRSQIVFCSLALFVASATIGFSEDENPEKYDESQLISNVRQLTFDGKRAGEGYFNTNGTEMVFQSERMKSNPFYQIYWMDLTTGDSNRISPGYGKTTCAWIHPTEPRVLFSSTHDDPEAKKKQQDELDFRASGKSRRYSWDYDSHYEIYSHDRTTGTNTRLTNVEGYDAEGSYSPDGKLIAFASNRLAYSKEMTKKQKEIFDNDAAFMNDIYIMNADGSGVKRLTEYDGYDGGPFFSPDGKRICWRRFSENGATAEIMTMNIDGSDKKKITKIGAMSWAPYYHPSGKYLIFTTNKHGFANFELYLVDVDGNSEPIRATTTEGFDGLPVFSPDGKKLSWTSNRVGGQSQIFMAGWNHEAALKLLNESQSKKVASSPAATEKRFSHANILPGDIIKHVEYLCRDDLAGRLTGTPGEKKATEYVATHFDDYKLLPAGDNGTYYQNFEFTSGVSLGYDNSLVDSQKSWKLGKDWQPVSFSATGPVSPAEIVFAGYGLVAPENKEKKFDEYDSYVHLDVKDKWVLVFRFLPEEISAEKRQHWGRFSSLRYKVMVARDKGAKGIIVVSGPTSKVKNQLIQLRSDGSLSGSSLPVISISDEVAQSWFGKTGKSLEALQSSLDSGDPAMGFVIKKVKLSSSIDIKQIKKQGRNVIGRLQVGGKPSKEVILIGAHVDHLGKGRNSGSLAKDEEKNQIHYGADDNASGTAVMLEIAEYMSHAVKNKNWKPKRDILFAAWSGEELGLLGSSHFANDMLKKMKTKMFQSPSNPHEVAGDKNKPDEKKSKDPHADPHAMLFMKPTLYPEIAACFNMDMVGRLDKKLVLQGIGSSSVWKKEIERRNVPVGLAITLQNDSYLPTDASTFFIKGVPILSAFTGSHEQYHTPRDTPDKLDYEGAAKIGKLMGLIAKAIAEGEKAPDYISQARPEKDRPRAKLRAYLGTIPDYAAGDIKGVKLSGVGTNGPASKAGVQGGDIIVELAGKKIDNIYDYTYAIEALKIGKPVTIVVKRNDKRIKLDLTPGSRD